MTSSLLAVLAVGCGESSDRHGQGPLACADLVAFDRPTHPNVVLVVNDTWRRDRVGAYGGPAATPAFDSFAERHLLFEHAFSQAPWTKPSIATLFTSLYPSQHGVLSHPSLDTGGKAATRSLQRFDLLDDDVRTLAERFAAAGYRTGAIVSNPWLAKGFGFEQGFEHYDDSFAAWDAPGEAVTDAALSWFDGADDERPVLLYVHYMDSHRPYPPLDRWQIDEREGEIAADERPLDVQAEATIREQVRLTDELPAVGFGLPPKIALLEMAYDRGVEEFDRAFAALLAGLESGPAWERTALLVTSDHGEALFERGFDNHGNSLYDMEIALPLAARLPGVEARTGRVSCVVGLIDLLPTLEDYAGTTGGGAVFGRSLLGRATESGATIGHEALVVSEGVMERPQNRALRLGDHKLLWQPQPGPDGVAHALFDIAADPGETRNLLESGDGDSRIDALFRDLAARVGSAVPPHNAAADDSLELDAERLERLRSLGYLQ